MQIPEETKPYALVLLSGGMDSAACVHFYKTASYDVETLFIDYGQRANGQEKNAAFLIAEYFKVNHRELKIQGAKRKEVGSIQARNAMLLFCGLAESRENSGILVLGVHAGTRYSDCSSYFIDCMQRVFDVYCDGRMIVSAPFVDWSKRDIYEYSKKYSLPLSTTYSCSKGGIPCGECESCLDRKVLNVC